MNSVRPASRSAFRFLVPPWRLRGRVPRWTWRLAQPSSVYSQVSGASAIWRLIAASSSGSVAGTMGLGSCPCSYHAVSLVLTFLRLVVLGGLEPLGVQTTWLQPVVDGDV